MVEVVTPTVEMTPEQAVQKIAVAYAGTLAICANLRPEQFTEFKQANPEFFPPAFWTGAMITTYTLNSKHGKRVAKLRAEWIQKLIQHAWSQQFPVMESLELISMGGFASEGSDNTPDATAERRLRLMGVSFGFRVWAFQQAVLLLHVQPWRASFCPKCGNRFVKNKPGDRFCGKVCAGSYRKQYQHELYLKDGKKWQLKAKKRLLKKTAKRGRRSFTSA
jgi:hypothetical protein